MEKNIDDLALVSTEVVFMTVKNDKIWVALKKFTDTEGSEKWALPERRIKAAESIDESVEKTIHEIAGIEKVYYKGQISVTGEKTKGERKVISIAYLAHCRFSEYKTSIPEEVELFQLDELPENIAYDHDVIIGKARILLTTRFKYSNVATFFLPEEFTLTQLQKLYSGILHQEFDKRNFRKKMLSLGFLEKTDKKQTGVSNRPAYLYRFKEKEFKFLEVLFIK